MFGGVHVVIPSRRLSGALDGLLSDLRRELGQRPQAPITVAIVDGTGVYDATDAESVVDATRLPGDGGDAGASANRNRGASTSDDADWLVFLDDDVRLPSGWLGALLDVTSDERTADITGGVISSAHPSNWYSQAAEDFVVRHRKYPEGWYLAAAMLVVRVRAFQRLNGFDESYKYGAEDWDLCKRAHALGVTVGVDTRVGVIHANPTTWNELLARADHYGRANARMDHLAALDTRSPALKVQQEPAAQVPPRSPLRIGRWLASEYRLLRSQGRSMPRSARSALLQGWWMRTYFQSYQATADELRRSVVTPS